MRTFSPEKPDELDLDLPALDGEDDGPETDAAHHDEALDVRDDGGNPLDDSTGEDTPLEEIAVEGTEGGWLVDAENAGTLDVGPFDVAIEPEGKILEDDEADGSGSADDLVATDEAFVADSGEEGPTDEDEELREEDLPALDADEDGDVPDDELYDRAMLGAADDDLRWDDRAWARIAVHASTTDEADDSGILAVPGDDAGQSTRDATWKRLDESGRLMAATFVPGGSVILALASADRTRAFLVRVQPDGEARIIAEVDSLPSPEEGPMPSESSDRDEDDDGKVCLVTFLRWDAARGCLFVGGNFGVEAYQPVLQ
jgi:hypothetical protein